jgi:hypothetical protein
VTRCSAAILASSLTLCCAKAPPITVSPGETTQPISAQRLDPAQIVEEVARIRGLALLHPIPIEIVDDEAMLAELRDSNEKFIAHHQADQAAWSAFDLIDPPARSLERDDSIVSPAIGMYTFSHKLLVLRRDFEGDAAIDRSVRSTLAHEIAHALQDQHFARPSIEDLSRMNNDELLAQRALAEGDARVVELDYEGSPPLRRSPPSREQMMMTAMELSLDRFVSSVRTRPEVGRPFYALISAFPYRDGGDFVARIREAGEPKILDKVFEHPPSSTSEILHPERYVRGQRALRIDAAASPPGYRPVAQGVLGELLVRHLLSSCAKTSSGASTLASRWLGDAYTVSQRADDIALSWRSVWTSTKAAAQVYAALKARASCFPPRSKTADPRFVIGNGFGVAQRGPRVAFVRGFDASQIDAEVAKAADFREERRPFEPPIGPIRIASRVGPLLSESVAIAGRRASNSTLGVSVDLPEGLTATNTALADLCVERSQGQAAVAALVRIDRVMNRGAMLGVFGAYADMIEKRMRPRFPIVRGPVALINTRFGLGVEQVNRIRYAPVFIRAVLIPACEQRSTLAFFELWRDEGGKHALDAWFKSLRFDDPRRLCP